MNPGVRKCIWVLALAVVATASIVVLSGIPNLRVGVLLWPGVVVAALFFPDGINSNWPHTYLALAGLLEMLILSGVIFGLMALISRSRHWRAGQQ